MLFLRASGWIILLLLALMGCSHTFTYAQLMRDPTLLKREVDYCRTHETMAATYCDTVLYAAAQFTSLLNEQQANPEHFGQRILNAQIACANSQRDCDEVAVLLAVVGVGTPE